MPRKAIGAISFASVYPMYVQKAKRKGSTRAELDEVTHWLTGYDRAGLDGRSPRMPILPASSPRPQTSTLPLRRSLA